MNFSQLKDKIVLYSMGLKDLSSSAGDLINMALHTLERNFNWRYMEKFNTGTITSASDNITEPTLYKETIAFFVTVDEQDKELMKTSFRTMLNLYKDDDNVKDTPDIFAVIKNSSNASRIYFRKWPDRDYPYKYIYYAYSSDLSGDGDENWWTINHWETLLYGALLEAEAFTRGEPEEVKRWNDYYTMNVEQLKKAQIDEELNGSIRQSLSGFPQVS